MEGYAWKYFKGLELGLGPLAEAVVTQNGTNGINHRIGTATSCATVWSTRKATLRSSGGVESAHAASPRYAVGYKPEGTPQRVLSFLLISQEAPLQ